MSTDEFEKAASHMWLLQCLGWKLRKDSAIILLCNDPYRPFFSVVQREEWATDPERAARFDILFGQESFDVDKYFHVIYSQPLVRRHFLDEHCSRILFDHPPTEMELFVEATPAVHRLLPTCTGLINEVD